MKRAIVLTAICLTFVANATAQYAQVSPRLVDLPTAGTLERGSYQIDLRSYTGGGLLASVNVGITERVLLGMSYGGLNLIGEGDVNWNPEPGIEARVRVIDENFTNMPAVTIGFDSQGFGPYSDSFERYETKSRGLFVVATKNYAMLENLGLHVGLNWSLERDDKDKELNVFIGGDLSLNPEFHLFAEYDFANNDNENDSVFGSGNGYFNGGIRWLFARQLFLQFNFKNLFENGPNRIRREFRVGYYELF